MQVDATELRRFENGNRQHEAVSRDHGDVRGELSESLLGFGVA